MAKLTDRVGEDLQSIGELWETLAAFSANRVEDNKKYNGEYPIDVRIIQVDYLKCLVKAIENFHEKFMEIPGVP